MKPLSLPLKIKLAYAAGMTGWSILINLISVILVYMYLPPLGSGLPALVSQATVFSVFNVVALVTAGGRLVDAIYDPLIAQWSDASNFKKGRRIPFMRAAILPSALFCFLVFFPLSETESNRNVAWLALTLVLFYMASTTFIIPYNALLPKMAGTQEEKVNLSTFQSLGYVFGIGLAANAFNMAALLQEQSPLEKLQALQVTILFLSLVAAFCMWLTTHLVDERALPPSSAKHAKLLPALRSALFNRNFRIFIIADMSYFIGITIITSGLMYFVTVLLGLSESTGNKLMIAMVLASLLFYYPFNRLSLRVGKKRLMVFSFLFLSLVFLGIYFLGKVQIDPFTQILSLVLFAALPFASLNILPNAIMADIIQEDTLASGENREAMFFAVRYFFVKIAQTLGIALFAILLGFGRNQGDDFGIRANGLLGFGLCLLASFCFMKFKELKK